MMRALVYTHSKRYTTSTVLQSIRNGRPLDFERGGEWKNDFDALFYLSTFGIHSYEHFFVCLI